MLVKHSRAASRIRIISGVACHEDTKSRRRQTIFFEEGFLLRVFVSSCLRVFVAFDVDNCPDADESSVPRVLRFLRCT
jgi:hypothetical protein